MHFVAQQRDFKTNQDWDVDMQGMHPCRIDPSQVEKVAQGYAMKGCPEVQVSSRAFKMSKSRGNVVNPDDVVFSFGADSLRLYEMFMGPLRETKVRSKLLM